MRLAMTSAVAFATILPLAFTTAVAASPLDWPQGDSAMARHCGAVLHAYGQAYALAADLSGQEARPVADLPAGLLQQAGGIAHLPEITRAAEAFEPHADSVARTSFYPTLVGDGTPYLADDGRELVMAVQNCLARYAL